MFQNTIIKKKSLIDFLNPFVNLTLVFEENYPFSFPIYLYFVRVLHFIFKFCQLKSVHWLSRFLSLSIQISWLFERKKRLNHLLIFVLLCPKTFVSFIILLPVTSLMIFLDSFVNLTLHDCLTKIVILLFFNVFIFVIVFCYYLKKKNRMVISLLTF